MVDENVKIAVVGATGNVGRTMLACLEAAGFSSNQVQALASHRSCGKQISFGDTDILTVKSLDTFDFSHVDLILSSAGSAIAETIARRIKGTKSIMIDNSSHFRMDSDVPLIVPEVNPLALGGFWKRNIIANPNCSTIQLVMVLCPLHQLSLIKRVVCSTYQSVSGAGKAAMDELYTQTKSAYASSSPSSPQFFSKPIAFNVIPHIDVFQDNGDTKEEWKMRVETKKILNDTIELSATCVRVPVFVGHCLSVNVEFHQEVDLKQAKKALHAFPGVKVIDNPSQHEYITPVDAAHDDMVFVSRMRQDPSHPCALNLWVVTDNLRKGAALNAVQIANTLISTYLWRT